MRGPNICLGYWRNEKATNESFDSEGFLKTGDVAIHDDKGWYWIVDRKKELIKVKGFQVAPAVSFHRDVPTWLENMADLRTIRCVGA